MGDYSFDYALSGQTHCCECLNKINKGDLRLIFMSFHGSQYPSKRYWCKKHAMVQIRSEVDILKKFQCQLEDELKKQ